MKILAIETTTKFLCLGASDGERLYECRLEAGRRHAELLAPLIKKVLDALGWKPPDIDYIACGLGPGSFTGIRIGLSTAEGLSLALKKPLVGIPTLDLIAENAAEKKTRYIMPLLDAKRNLVFCCLYKDGRRISRDFLLSPQQAFKKIRPSTAVTGDALALYKEEIARIKGAQILDRDYWYPRPHYLLRLAIKRIKKRKFSRSHSLKPVYLFPKECQVSAAALK